MDTDEKHEGGDTRIWVGSAVPADRLYVLTGIDRIYRIIQKLSHHEEHEGSEGKPGSAGRLTGFMHFW